MILMIKINLLPAKEGKRRRSSSSGGGRQWLAILMLLLVIEMLVLYVWHDGVAEEASQAAISAKRAEDKIASLEKKKAQLEEREQAKLELARQNVIFEKLKAEKTGPPEMLKFLSYVLTKKEDNLYNREELKAQEAAGWASGWDTHRLWLTEVSQSDSDFAITGLARSHEDVAEFYRRLESGIYFVEIDPVQQKVTPDKDFADRLELVEFDADTFLNYNSDGELKMKREDVPERLVRLIPKPKEPEKPKGGKGKKGKAAKGGH